MNTRSLITMIVAVLGSMWCVYWAYGRWYAEPRDAIETRMATFQTDIEKFDRKLRERVQIEETLRGYADRTLGADRETVDHRLRTRLNRIGEELGVTPTVTTGRTAQVASPARSVFKRHKTLRDRIDLVELDASISAEGTLEQATELVHRIQVEPWLKQITQVAVKPKSNGESVTVTVRLRTMFIPGRSPEEVETPEYDGAGFDDYLVITNVNPFRLPPPPAPPAPPPVVADPAPAQPTPSFPYGQWTITGVASGPTGPEVWVRNHKSGANSTLSLGVDWNGLILERVEQESAIFRVDGELVRIQVGSNLSDRRLVDL